jgi:predicted CXXCH cytochrome family protein
MGWENSPHAKAGVSCLACHGLHRSAAAPLLKRRADALCLSCHAKGGSFLHQNAAAREKRRANCASCHEPHRGVKLTAGGEAWHLKKAVTHRPVAEGKCNACHQVHQAPLLPGQSAALDEDVDEPEAGPSGGPNRSLLSQPPATICYECHGEKKELFLRTKHTRAGQWARPPRDNACAACHLPHGSDYAQLTTYDGSLLCLTCHPEKTPHHFLAVAGVRLAKLACGECHNPHGTPHPALLVRDRRDICGQCHRK